MDGAYLWRREGRKEELKGVYLRRREGLVFSIRGGGRGGRRG
jgi:ABC-type histidine transport system ATPase subunit